MTEIQLSPPQAAVVASDANAIVVSAGAGSGKTEIVAHRVERVLVESPDEDFQILAVSYTVKAAEELRQRLRDRLGGLHQRVTTETIHGFALSLLRQFGTRVGLPPEPEILARDEDRIELLQQWLADEGRDPLDDPIAVFARLDLARAECRSAEHLDSWRTALAQRGALDYPAILERAAELLDGPWVARHLRRTYRHVVVDEAQNVTPAQYRVLTGVIGDPAADHPGALLVGDERQSIVGFAGADPGLMSRFADEYGAARFELPTNHRSAHRIVEVAAAVADKLGRTGGLEPSGRYAAEGSVEIQTAPNEGAEGDVVAAWVAGLLGHGLPEEVLAPGEGRRLAPKEIAVLGRSAASLRPVKSALDRRGIEWAEGSTPDEWVESPTAKLALDVIAHRAAPDHLSVRRRITEATHAESTEWSTLRDVLCRAPDSAVQQLAVAADVAGPEEFLGELGELQVNEDGWTADLAQLSEAWDSFIDRVGESGRTFGNFSQHIFRVQRGNLLDAGVRILTIHKAQGREFTAVALVACNVGQIPDFRATEQVEQEAELRAFYVAVSRASRALLLTRALQRETRFGPRPTQPSPFLKYAEPWRGAA